MPLGRSPLRARMLLACCCLAVGRCLPALCETAFGPPTIVPTSVLMGQEGVTATSFSSPSCLVVRPAPFEFALCFLTRSVEGYDVPNLGAFLCRLLGGFAPALRALSGLFVVGPPAPARVCSPAAPWVAAVSVAASGVGSSRVLLLLRRALPALGLTVLGPPSLVLTSVLLRLEGVTATFVSRLACSVVRRAPFEYEVFLLMRSQGWIWRVCTTTSRGTCTSGGTIPILSRFLVSRAAELSSDEQ